MKPILVTTNTHPDLDGYACAVAYAEYLNKKGRPAIAGLFGEYSLETQFVVEHYHFTYPMRISNVSEYGQIALVDTSSTYSLNPEINPERVIEVIDHRIIHKTHFTKAKYQMEYIGAAATLIAEKFKQNNIPISKEAAVLLHTAIISNTLNFQAKITHARDHEMAEWLNEKSPLPPNFTHQMFKAKSNLPGEKLCIAIENDFADYGFANQKVGIGQLEVVESTLLIKNRLNEIILVLKKIATQNKLDFFFLSIADLGKNFTYFVTEHVPTQQLLTDIFRVTFEGPVAIRKGLILRKEIFPQIKEKLEK